MNCSKCGMAFDRTLAGGCPQCGTLVGDAPEPRAGFWLRFAAHMVDGLVLWLGGTIAAAVSTLALTLALKTLFGGSSGSLMSSGLGVALRLVPQLVFLAVSAAYYTWMTARDGQTLGKKLLQIRVVNLDGSAVSHGTALLRWVGYFLSYAPLGLGYLWVGFSREKRGFHDMVAGTKVVRLEAEDSKVWVLAAVIGCGALLFVLLTIGLIAAIAIPKFADLTGSANEGATKGSLGMLRSAASIHYGDTEGTYPADLASMIPKYLTQIPKAKTPGYHPESDEVHLLYSLRPDPGAMDTGGWGYYPDPTDEKYGTIIVNCTHTDRKGKEWNGY